MKRNRATEAVKYQTPHGQLIPVPALTGLPHTPSQRVRIPLLRSAAAQLALLPRQVQFAPKLHP
jgi:hypothetical protein